MAKKPGFTVQVRHDGGAAGSVRFQVHDKVRATLAFPGHSEQAPSPAGTVEDLDLDSLRAGRFIRVDEEGRRRSYQLSRLDRTNLLAVGAEDWHSLSERNDGGFRYLMLPETARPAAVASVQLSAAAKPAPARGAGLRARAMAAGRTMPPTPAPALRAPAPKPPKARPTAVASTRPIATELADKALAELGRDEAISRLGAAYTELGALRQEAADLQARLEASRQREADLIEVLGRWQSRSR
ncbi:MAG: hypothetical protein KC912_03975 [Proteobacteria bacterium]|nr:hypothetical protein [Pseudomonadota bacterium]